jgi:hypothetical protein
MSGRVDFEIVGPNDHNQTVTFSRKEFEETLKSGALVFHCLPPMTTLPKFEGSSRRIQASSGWGVRFAQRVAASSQS